MILTKNVILNEMKKGRIKITPFNKSYIGDTSIDLTLDNKFRVFSKRGKITLSEDSDYKKFLKLVEADSIVVHPGQFILGITKETIKLPDDICGWLSGRSRFARLGLVIHVTASFVHPGVDNKQVLEIKNVGTSDLVLKKGLRICQLILERTEGKAKYRGKFQRQSL